MYGPIFIVNINLCWYFSTNLMWILVSALCWCVFPPLLTAIWAAIWNQGPLWLIDGVSKMLEILLCAALSWFFLGLFGHISANQATTTAEACLRHSFWWAKTSSHGLSCEVLPWPCVCSLNELVYLLKLHAKLCELG